MRSERREMIVGGLELTDVSVDELSRDERHLLMHTELMTVRMEQHYRQSMRIEVLDAARVGDDIYERETLLIGVQDGVARQLAHLQVHLTAMGPGRADVLAETMPFGKILERHRLQVSQYDLRIFRTAPDETLSARLGQPTRAHHGRRYSLRIPTGKPLAVVTEILP